MCWVACTTARHRRQEPKRHETTRKRDKIKKRPKKGEKKKRQEGRQARGPTRPPLCQRAVSPRLVPGGMSYPHGSQPDTSPPELEVSHKQNLSLPSTAMPPRRDRDLRLSSCHGWHMGTVQDDSHVLLIVFNMQRDLPGRVWVWGQASTRGKTRGGTYNNGRGGRHRVRA